jgi:hypothetical protein
MMQQLIALVLSEYLIRYKFDFGLNDIQSEIKFEAKQTDTDQS